MVQLPIGVHPSWRGEFQHRWQRARVLLILSFGLTPVVTAGAGLAMLAGLGALDAPTAALGVAATFAVLTIGYLWWFLLGGRAGKSLSLWGTRVGIAALVQSMGVSVLVQNASGQFSNGITLGVPAAVFFLGILGGIAGWRAYAIMFAGPEETLALTSLPIEDSAVALVGPLNYAGNLLMDGTSLSWQLSWRLRRNSILTRNLAYKDSVALADIVDARLVPVPDLRKIPPLAYLADGRPVYPQPGELLVVRTPQREVGVPAQRPQHMYQLLSIRCDALRAARQH